MERGLTGRYGVTRLGGEDIRGFVPRPLPLDGVSLLLPAMHLFLYA